MKWNLWQRVKKVPWADLWWWHTSKEAAQMRAMWSIPRWYRLGKPKEPSMLKLMKDSLIDKYCYRYDKVHVIETGNISYIHFPKPFVIRGVGIQEKMERGLARPSEF